jgi:hypothetical protein
MKLYSILVTTSGIPAHGSLHVVRYGGRFFIAHVASATPGPPDASMPAWAVTWDVDDAGADSPAAMVMARQGFAFDARATGAEALRWHAIDERHWLDHGYAPNHWE